MHGENAKTKFDDVVVRIAVCIETREGEKSIFLFDIMLSVPSFENFIVCDVR